MQFLVTITVTLDRRSSAPPDEFQAAMTAFVEAETRAGSFVLTGGLAPPSDGAHLTLSGAGVIQSDARVPLHGFAVVEAPALDRALDVASRMMRLHQDYVPGWEVDCEVRPIVTHCLP